MELNWRFYTLPSDFAIEILIGVANGIEVDFVNGIQAKQVDSSVYAISKILSESKLKVVRLLRLHRLVEPVRIKAEQLIERRVSKSLRITEIDVRIG